jgi:hypothetical protein
MTILEILADKFRQFRAHSVKKQEHLAALRQDAEDGELTEAEMAELNRLREDLDADLDGVRIKALNHVYAAAKSDGQVTVHEVNELQRFQKYLRLQEGEVAGTQRELARLRLRYEVEQGNLPTVRAIGFVVQRDERVQGITPVTLLEERVVARQTVGSFTGESIRICPRVRHRVGASRVSIGCRRRRTCLLTALHCSSRTSVGGSGDKKSFVIKFENSWISNYTAMDRVSRTARASCAECNSQRAGTRTVLGSCCQWQ